MRPAVSTVVPYNTQKHTKYPLTVDNMSREPILCKTCLSKGFGSTHNENDGFGNISSSLVLSALAVSVRQAAAQRYYEQQYEYGTESGKTYDLKNLRIQERA